jgi:hypothetical protein
MKSYQSRVIEERALLDLKIVKLHDYIFSGEDGEGSFNRLEIKEQNRMSNQLIAMEHYSRILSARIAEFKP